MPIEVSVVIPTLKRAALLKRCLDALLLQTLDPSAYEIIVVDDGPDGGTRELIESYALGKDAPRVRYLAQCCTCGPAAARNRGWRAAEGRTIAFTDDDCIPERDWLSRGLAAFGDGIAGVTGRIFVPLGRRPTDHELNTSFLEFSEFATANCFYRKDVLEEVGGFDERFTRAWREDADLFFTLLAHDKRLVKEPEAIVVHPVRSGWWGSSIRDQSKTLFNALLYKKHPGLYRKHIKNPVLGYYYIIVASCLLFLLTLSLGAYNVAPAPFLLWMAATGVVCHKRLERTSHAPLHVLEMIVTSLIIPFLSIYWRLTGAVRFQVMFY